MATPLVIVDSEIKGRTLRSQFEGEMDILLISAPPVAATHKRVEGKGKSDRMVFEFLPLPSGQEFIEALSAHLQAEIYLALDSDQRSEYLGWVISGYISFLSKSGTTMRRLNLLGLTRETLRESFRLVDMVQDEQAVAFYVRLLFNALLGKHLLRLIGTKVGPGNLPINFSSLTVLSLISERDYQIKVYSPPVKWQISVKLQFAGAPFMAKLHTAYGVTDDGVFRDLAETRSVVAGFKNNGFQVTGVERTELLIRPPQPYLLGELLVEAQVLYGIGPKKVYDAVWNLFHGVEVQGVMTGLISQFLPFANDSSAMSLERVRRQVEVLFGEGTLGETMELAGGVGLLLPLRPEVEPKDLPEGMAVESRQIYAMIRERALASQMRAAAGESLHVQLAAGEDFLFSAHCTSIAEKNFLHVYQGRYDRGLLTPNPLAALTAGETVENLQIVPEQSRKLGEEYYTVESLFAELTEFSMVLDPENILLLQQMLDAGYLSLNSEGFFRLQENGNKLVEIMKQVFPTMRGINLSAYMEQTMVEVLSGRKLLDSALVHFDQTLMLRGVGMLKVKLPVRVQPRGRISSSVIKVAPPVKQATASEPTRATPELVVGEESVAGEGGEGGSAAVSDLVAPMVSEPEVESLDLSAESESAAGGTEPVAEEVLVAEALSPPAPDDSGGEGMVPSLLVEEDLPPDYQTQGESAFLPEEEDTWSENAQDAFSQTLQPIPEKVGVEIREEEPQEMEAETLEHHAPRACRICGKLMLLKKDRFGKFWSCSAFPACRHSESYREEEAVMLCPVCGVGKVIMKRTPTGKNFYLCPDRNCDFMAWAPPHAIPCQVCDSPFLVEKKTASGVTHLRCPRAGCDYMQPMPGDSGEELLEESAPVAPAAPARKMVRVRRVASGAAGGSGGTTKKVRVVRRK